jgi:hypothetical protein
MANTVEPASLTNHRREPVVETALRLTQELLRIRPEGTSFDQWLASIHGLTRAMSEVATVTRVSTCAAPRGIPPAGRTFLPLARGRGKAKAGGVGRVKCPDIKKKNVSPSMKQSEHPAHPPALRDLLLLKQRPRESLHSFTQRFADLYLQLPKVSERLVVDAFDAGTTNQQVVEDLMLSPGLSTIARLSFRLPTSMPIGSWERIPRQCPHGKKVLSVTSDQSLLNGTQRYTGPRSIMGGSSRTPRLGGARGLTSSKHPMSCHCF